jgi:uncharacterized membrane protein (UPF0127 family)
MRFSMCSLLAVVVMAWTGCADQPGPAPAANSTAAAGATNATPGLATPAPTPNHSTGWNPTNAQPKLPTLKLFVGPEVITAELALTDPQIRTGMMFRESMAEQDGMLFVFARPHRTAFYMKNTKVPLTAAYIDPDGVILEMVELNALNETPVEAKFDNVQFVLEMNQGWFKRHKILPGTVIGTERGPLRRVFP